MSVSETPLSYLGLRKFRTVRVITRERNPLATDDKFELGDQWVNTLTNVNFLMASNKEGAAVWNQLAASASVQTISGIAADVLGNFAINAGSGINITPGVNSITIATTGTGITWNNNATTTTMAALNGYIVTAGAQVFTLPATSAIGDELEILLNGGTSWQIAQGAGQSVVVNNAITTVGAGGSITSTGAGQSIKLVCVVANTKWQVTSLIGNPTVV